LDDVIDLLNSMVAPGSELHMLNEIPIEERAELLRQPPSLFVHGFKFTACRDGGLDVSELQNLKLVHFEGNSAVKRHLTQVVNLLAFLCIAQRFLARLYR
jgi:hypothetical protein